MGPKGRRQRGGSGRVRRQTIVAVGKSLERTQSCLGPLRGAARAMRPVGHDSSSRDADAPPPRTNRHRTPPQTIRNIDSQHATIVVLTPPNTTTHPAPPADLDGQQVRQAIVVRDTAVRGGPRRVHLRERAVDARGIGARGGLELLEVFRVLYVREHVRDDLERRRQRDAARARISGRQSRPPRGR